MVGSDTWSWAARNREKVSDVKLYHNPASPFVRMVRVCIEELNLINQVELFDVVVTPTTPGDDVPSKNPLGKIPALERDGGATLYDSRVICQYLNDLATGSLYPEPPMLWETLTLEATAQGIADAAVLMVYEGRVRPEEKQYDDWVEAQWLKISRGLDAVESRWMSHLAGPLDMAQISMGCALAYLDFRHGARDWRAGRPSLAAWEKKFATRASMQATRPE